MDFHLKLPDSENPNLFGYTDADGADNNAAYKPIGDFLCMFGDGPTLWAGYKQDVVALSSTESQFIAATVSFRELLWLEKLMSDFTIQQDMRGSVDGGQPKPHQMVPE